MKLKITTHEMRLDKNAFELMKQGSKTLELRLLDEKRQQVKIGDHITFKLFPTLDHECTMEVTALLHYPDFNSLLDDVDMVWLGYDDSKRDWVKQAMYNIYTPEEEKEFGALGIRLKQAVV